MECWILYDREDLERNRFFAERLRDIGSEMGMDTVIVTTDSVDGAPDVVVSRARDWKLSKRLEDEGALVVNGSEVCRIADDKLLTYRMCDDLAIPHLPVSLPGEPLPGGPPWVVKSRSGHGGSQVLMAHDATELEEACASMPDPLIQETAPVLGRDMRAYVLDGEILACVMRSSDSDFRANYSLGGKAELCDCPGGCREIIEKVVGRLDPVLIGVDFVFGDDRVYLNEVEDAVGTRMLYSLTDLDPARLLMDRVSRRLHSKRSL